MPRYTWQDNSSVTQADVKENLSYRFAILRPHEGLSDEALHALPARLQRHGLVATPDSADGKPVLRVRGFKAASDLFEILRKEGITSAAAPTQAPLEEELNPEIKSMRTYLKEHSIQVAGFFYLIADTMPILSGVIRKTPDEVVQGSAWAATSVALMLFGRKNPEIQMGNLYRHMKDFMAQEGLELSGDPAQALEQLQGNQGYFSGLLNFFYEHPVLFNNTIQGYGGLKQIGAGRAQNNPFKTAAGFGPMIGMWGGLLIPEDKYAGMNPEEKAEALRLKAQGEEPENGFHTKWYENPVAWIHEKPLRLSGIGPIIGNLLTACSALFHDRNEVNHYFGFEGKQFELNPATLWRDASRTSHDLLRTARNGQGLSREALMLDRTLPEWQRQHANLDRMINTQLGWKITMGSPIFNIIANTLYGMSSKEERSVNLNKAGYIDELLSVAANIYAHVPAEQRGEKLTRFAGFLRNQPDVNISEKDIRARIENKIDALEKTGWAKPVASEEPSKPAQLQHETANDNHQGQPKTHVKTAQLKAQTANDNGTAADRGWAGRIASKNHAAEAATSL